LPWWLGRIRTEASLENSIQWQLISSANTGSGHR
jgi:hypothetical protein